MLFDQTDIPVIVASKARFPLKIPWHLACKKVPYVDERGQRIDPAKENALKFERFIFDVLPLAERWTVLATPREEEFAPVKNAEGVDSPATCRRAIRCSREKTRALIILDARDGASNRSFVQCIRGVRFKRVVTCGTVEMSDEAGLSSDPR